MSPVLRPAIARVLDVASRRRALVLASVALLALASAEGVRRLSFDADVLSLLPQTGRVTPAFREFLARFGSLDQLYVVFTAPEGHAIDEYRPQIDTWIAELRRAPEIAGVDAGTVDDSRDFGWLADRQLLLFRGAALDDALRRLQPDGIARAVADSRELLAVPSAEVAELVRQDPVGLLALLRTSVGGTQAAFNVGGGRDGYVTQDGQRRLLLARPRRPPYDAEFSRALDERLRQIAAAIGGRAAPGDEGEEPLPALRVDFAGGHRIAVETEAVVKRESILNSVGSLAFILPFLYLVFRSLWLVVVGPLPAALSLFMVLGGLGFFGAQLSAAGTGAAAMLFGLGIDGVVLLYATDLLARARAEAGEGAELAGASTSMLLGMWTTAATFYGLMFVDFPSLQQLGLLIGHSMVICGLLTLVLVPALLPRRRSRRHRPLALPSLASWVSAHRLAIVVGAVVVTAVLGAASLRLRIDPTLDRLRSATPAAQLEVEIGKAFGLPDDVYVVLARGDDLERLLSTNERLVARIESDLPSLTVDAPTRLLPSAATQASAAAEVEAARLSPDAVRASLEQARIQAGFREGAFDPFGTRLPRLLDTTQRVTFDGYAEHGLGDLLARFIVRDGRQWLMATYAFPGNEEQVTRLQAIIAEVDASQTLTGLSLVNRELERRFGPEFVKGLGIGAALVVALIIGAFRNARLAMFALLPTVLGLVWTAGLLALGGVELDLFAVFGVVTLLGIGVDYGVHLVHRCHERGDAVQATEELAPVILIAAALTILGYGTLVTSSYPPLRSIGLVSVVSVVALAAASVLVLPALLARRRAS
jgi:predicted RND superfamily exporter protein